MVVKNVRKGPQRIAEDKYTGSHPKIPFDDILNRLEITNIFFIKTITYSHSSLWIRSIVAFHIFRQVSIYRSHVFYTNEMGIKFNSIQHITKTLCMAQ